MQVRTIAVVLLTAASLAVSATPVLAWWQFVALGPNGERQVYSPYPNERVCNARLKQVEKALEKKYPDKSRFPLVGSCEEYH
jgi:hypothetical protein